MTISAKGFLLDPSIRFDSMSESFTQTDVPEINATEIVRWTAVDRILAIMLGYCFFATVSLLYLHLSGLVFRVKKGEKLEGLVADSIRQAGGVSKVIFIIGIEMILFPFYCGLLLDIALLPLFKDASIASRLAFFQNAPATALFIHWFLRNLLHVSLRHLRFDVSPPNAERSFVLHKRS